jgi:hypothetical protein
MSYRLEMVAEVRAWLRDLRRTDRDTAILVGQATTALRRLPQGAGTLSERPGQNQRKDGNDEHARIHPGQFPR